MTNAEILNLRVEAGDINETTIGGYLQTLLATMWEEGEGFSGKRPFGNSGWQYDLYKPLVKAGVVTGSIDADGYIDDIDTRTAHDTIARVIQALFESGRVK